MGAELSSEGKVGKGSRVFTVPAPWCSPREEMGVALTWRLRAGVCLKETCVSEVRQTDRMIGAETDSGGVHLSLAGWGSRRWGPGTGAGEWPAAAGTGQDWKGRSRRGHVLGTRWLASA